ncbi:MAG TPA: hypothetical protein VID48_04560 [Solirubrobacteraceae bacterium]
MIGLIGIVSILALAVAIPRAGAASGGSSLPGARAAVVEVPPPPGNDTLSGAQAIHTLPATLQGSTVGATTEPQEHESACQGSTSASVWYSLRFPQTQRIAVELAAGGALDAVVDVYHAVRSQVTSVGCQETDAHGKASLSFKAVKNGLYYIRVAALPDSALAGFSLVVFLPTPAVEPPGRPLSASGTRGQVDRLQNVNAAYYFTMRAGVSYLINLASQTNGACVKGALFAPGTSSFEGGALLRVSCGGYRLFTPGPGQGGRYSYEITPQQSYKRVQRFRLQVAPANSSQTAPGVQLGNYAHAHGRLNSEGVQVLRLYRLDVTSHSNLTLKLIAPGSANFNLQLRNQNGNVLDCQCGESGSVTLQRQLNPGVYYAVASTRGVTKGNYTLVRESRTITSTAISFSASKIPAGQSVGIDVKVTPQASGPVTVELQRFDPVFGWQFYRQDELHASEGSASLSFTPPAVGRWRANASYGGSRASSPSAVGFSYLLVS